MPFSPSNPPLPRAFTQVQHVDLIARDFLNVKDLPRYMSLQSNPLHGPEALYPEGTGKVLRCNCSICTKNGYFLVYPLRHDVAFGPGCEEKLKSYLMGLKTKPHRFCPECSSSILIDFENSTLEKERKFLAVNAAMFTDFDLDKAEIQTFDGRERLGPKYEA